MSEVMNYSDYVSIQKQIVDALNLHLPTITGFPCDYVEVQHLADMTPSLSIVFVPEAYEYMSDMVGSFREVSFQLNYKQFAPYNEQKLQAISDLEYLTESLKGLEILTGVDKIVLDVKGSTSPSVVQFDEAGQDFVFQSVYTINYKQKHNRKR